MGEAAKRKGGPGDGSQGRQLKKSKGGNQGKWQTPHQKAKIEAHKGKAGTLEVGDVGFWVSCQRTKEQKALIELAAICDEYGEKIYGIERQAVAEDSDDDDADIEASIQKEIESMNTTACFFVKTKPPVEPRELVRRICEEAQVITDRGQRKSRFINRFIPITLMGKATENGVEELAKTVLAEHFQLVGVDDKPQDEQNQGPSYAIRYSSRAHSTLKRDEVIKQIAALIGPRHKVNLTAPDKVVIIEIYQTFCGMSVVDGDFDALKRYNLNELYVAAMQANEKANELKEGDSRVKKDGPEVQKDESEAKEPSD